jgi:hypothetical protein
MRFITSILLLTATPAAALPPCSSVVLIERTEDATCAGQLVPDEVLAKLLAKRHAAVAACEREANHALALKDAELDLVEGRLDLCSAHALQLERAADEALRAMPKPVAIERSVWQSPWLWGPLSAIVAGTLGVLAERHLGD